MTAEVVSLAEYRAALEPHSSGVARCFACGYIWVATAPAGVHELECPVCRTMHGLFRESFCLAEQLACDTCGCEAFRVGKGGVYCFRCGERMVF
jgi:hypothetical protein